MPTSRKRSFDRRKPVVGSYWNYYAVPKTVTTSQTQGEWGTCDDVLGNWWIEYRGTRGRRRFRFKRYRANALLITKNFRRQGLISGVRTNVFTPGGVDRIMSSWPCAHSPIPKTAGLVFPDPVGSELDRLVIKGLGKTNPSVPNVSIPAFIGELRELPSLVKDWGGSLIRKLAKANITVRWGLNPLVSDVTKLLNFQKAVAYRFRMLEGLSRRGTVSRKAIISRKIVKEPIPKFVANSVGAFMRLEGVTVHTEKKWMSVLWTAPPGANLPKTDLARHFMARRLVLGLTSYEAIAAGWELLPWSWFADWFGSFGDYIASQNNTLGLIPTQPCLMRTLTSCAYYQVAQPSDSWARWDQLPSEIGIVKLRKIVSIPTDYNPVEALAPLVEGSHWSILASLQVLKSDRFKLRKVRIGKRNVPVPEFL